MSLRHFLSLEEIDPRDLRAILDNARAMKAEFVKGRRADKRPLEGKILAMIFEKPSTRTRVSFDVAMRQLGGEPIYMNGREMQLGRGESIADTARVLSRYVDGVMIRTHAEAALRELADNASVPVINGLTDASHPCQIMADVMTYEERKGPIAGARIAWSGDGNNVARSFIHAAGQFGFELRLACPAERAPDPEAVAWARARGATIVTTEDPEAAVDGVDCVVADTWVSMGDEDVGTRHNVLAPYQVNKRLMGRARRDAIFMHCLPAHRGEEVTAEVIDGPQSVVFDEAENRVHAQKAVLAWCMGAD